MINVKYFPILSPPPLFLITIEMIKMINCVVFSVLYYTLLQFTIATTMWLVQSVVLMLLKFTKYRTVLARWYFSPKEITIITLSIFVIDFSWHYRIRENDVVDDDARCCNIEMCIVCIRSRYRLFLRASRVVDKPQPAIISRTVQNVELFFSGLHSANDRRMTRCHTRIKMNGRAVDGARNSFLWSSFA